MARSCPCGAPEKLGDRPTTLFGHMTRPSCPTPSCRGHGIRAAARGLSVGCPEVSLLSDAHDSTGKHEGRITNRLFQLR